MVNIPFEIFDYEIYGYAALAIAAVVLSVVTIRRKAALSHWVADNALDADADEAMPLPALSVIVLTSGCDAELLASNIPLMMSQNYPDFEIIVVNADASESVDDAMPLLQVEYPQLRSTFIPDSTANVSKRKLGITLGVKAAKNDIVVVTSAKCRPQSDLWLNASDVISTTIPMWFWAIPTTTTATTAASATATARLTTATTRRATLPLLSTATHTAPVPTMWHTSGRRFSQ